MKKIVICFILLIVFISSVNAATVFVKDGNIYYKDADNTKQLTSLGLDDTDAVIHPKGEWIYFVRSTPGAWKGEKYYPAKGEVVGDGILKDELWRIKTDGTQAKRLLQNDKAAIDGPDPDYVHASIFNIQFSPDGDKVYFETPNWVTSAGLHVMNPDGSDEKLLGVGNGTKIVASARENDPKYGSCGGYIVTSQHRYWWFGGSYDWWYLFTPDFKEVGPLGDDFGYFTEMGEIIYTDHSEKTIKRSEKLRELDKNSPSTK